MKKIIFLFIILCSINVAFADDIYSQVAHQDLIYKDCLKRLENNTTSYAPIGSIPKPVSKESIKISCDKAKVELDRLKSFLPAPAKTESTSIKEVPLSGMQKESINSIPQITSSEDTQLKNLSIIAHYISEQDKKIEAQQTYIASVHSQLNIIYIAIIVIMLWIIAEIIIFLAILKKI